MSYRNYKTWDQAFAEANESVAKHKAEMAMTNKLFPKKDGTKWENWVGLSQEKRDQVYYFLYDYNTNTNKVG